MCLTCGLNLLVSNSTLKVRTFFHISNSFEPILTKWNFYLSMRGLGGFKILMVHILLYKKNRFSCYENKC